MYMVKLFIHSYFCKKGQYDRLSNYWHPEIPKGGPKLLDSMVLSTGQVFLIFAVLIFASIGEFF